MIREYKEEERLLSSLTSRFSDLQLLDMHLSPFFTHTTCNGLTTVCETVSTFLRIFVDVGPMSAAVKANFARDTSIPGRSICGERAKKVTCTIWTRFATLIATVLHINSLDCHHFLFAHCCLLRLTLLSFCLSPRVINTKQVTASACWKSYLDLGRCR